MNKDILPFQYIAALEEKYIEQVNVNKNLLVTVQELTEEIARLRSRLREEVGAICIEEIFLSGDYRGEA